jgi:urease accessory protein UreH
MPEPFILFPESDFRSYIAIDVHEDAHALITDGMMVHDPTTGAVARFRYYRSETEIRVNHHTIALDRTVIDDADRLFRSMVGMQRHAAQSTLLMVSPGTDIAALLNVVREGLAGCAQVYAGASCLPDGIGVSARILATDGVALRQASHVCWAAFRRSTVGRQITKRRK